LACYSLAKKVDQRGQKQDKKPEQSPWEDKLNISISTTQWGDVKQITSGDSTIRQPRVIKRNVIMALTTVTLAGLMVIQAVGPAVLDNRPVVDDVGESSVEIASVRGFLALEELSTETNPRAELSNIFLTPNGEGSSAVAK
jgi:hypothetical protein